MPFFQFLVYNHCSLLLFKDFPSKFLSVFTAELITNN